jgi:hypothetical protein
MEIDHGLAVIAIEASAGILTTSLLAFASNRIVNKVVAALRSAMLARDSGPLVIPERPDERRRDRVTALTEALIRAGFFERLLSAGSAEPYAGLVAMAAKLEKEIEALSFGQPAFGPAPFPMPLGGSNVAEMIANQARANGKETP